MSLSIFDHPTCSPFAFLGLAGGFWDVNTEIVVATWIAMIIIAALAVVGRWYLSHEQNLVSIGYEKIILFFADLSSESFGLFKFDYFVFVTSLFIFSFMNCIVGLLPHVEEATRDLNTTLALSVTSFLYVQKEKIKAHGITGFLQEFIYPSIIMAPIHIVGEFSKIASMAFRLFGNILGGGVILGMIIDLIGSQKTLFFGLLITVGIFTLVRRYIRPVRRNVYLAAFYSILTTALFLITWIQLFLGVFEGLIQSFVLTMLTITYLAMGTAEHEHSDTKEQVA